MSIIEKAAKRLEELRRAGVGVPDNKDSDVDSALNLHALKISGLGSGASSATDLSEDLPGSSNHSASAQSKQRYVELNMAQLAAAGFVTPNAPRSGIADEFRVLKRPLIANASGKGAAAIESQNLIMVTSAVPGEGKSFCAINLAMSIAMELDRTVLLVDADVARPSLPRLLGLPTARGLLDVLLDKSIDLGQVLIRTSAEKFTVLTSGTPQPRATELLASDAMSQLLTEMASRYSDRIIIFDSPPLLVATEARALATQVGQIVFVVEAEATLQSEVKQALAAIEACPVKMMVLNQARTMGQGAYGYGRGYGYGYGN